MIVVHELAIEFQHPCMAKAADAAAAQIGYLHAGSFDAFEQALIVRYVHADLRTGEEYLEGVADRRRAELLPMDMAVGPAAGARGVDDVIDHARGTADVDMRAQGLRREQRLERNHLSFTVMVQVKPFTLAPAQALQERGVLRRAN